MGKYINGVYVTQYEIHVYTTTGSYTLRSDGRADALALAAAAWEDMEVYKVKVWDLRKGPVEPNRPAAAGLIKEYV